MKTLLAITALTLTACASVQWEPLNTNTQRAHAECDYQASAAVAGQGDAVWAGWQKGELINKCMTLKGYHVKR